MYIDLLGQDNYISYNIKLAKYLGLHSAIYISCLLRVKSKSIDKRATFDVDRNYISDLCFIKPEEQKSIESALKKVGILTDISEMNDNLVSLCLHEDVLINMITDTDVKTLTKIKKSVDVKLDVVTGKMTTRQRQCYELKNKIQCSNDELLQAYRDWVDGVYANPKGFLSIRSISVFQKTVDDFANGDLDLALKIIEIATVNGYRDCTWAINLFNKDYAAKWKKEHSNNVSTTKKVEVNEDEVF